jgi:very-short-patch-repair endonuclease
MVLGVWANVAVSGTREQRMAQIAARQRGRVATRQLRAAGISASAISRLVASSRLLPVHRGVVAVGHAAPTPLGDETAALLAIGDTAALSHFSAATLWGLIAPGAGDGLIHVVSSEDHRIPLTGVTVHRSRILERRDVWTRQGLPLTSPARTLLDIAPARTNRQLELAFDRAIVERILTPAHVVDVLARAGGHHGRKRLTTLLERQAAGHTVTRSEAEERVLALIRSAGLTEPLVNARVAGHEVDFFWPGSRFALEIDGFRFHGTRERFERDRRKDSDLRRAGVTMARATWRMVEEEPNVLLVDLARGVQAV